MVHTHFNPGRDFLQIFPINKTIHLVYYEAEIEYLSGFFPDSHIYSENKEAKASEFPDIRRETRMSENILSPVLWQ
jgi:hypothetical protein